VGRHISRMQRKPRIDPAPSSSGRICHGHRSIRMAAAGDA
jgi:hypothetical protein